MKERSSAPVSSAEINRPALFAAACAGLAVFGVTIVLLGTIFHFEAMAQRLSVDLPRLGTLAMLLLTGVWLSTLVLGPIIDKFGNKMVLALSSLAVAVSMGVFAMTESFAVAGAVCFALGFSGGGLNIATNALVSAMYGEKRGAYLNYLGLFFSVGALALSLTAFTLARRAEGHLPASHVTGLMWVAAALAALVGVVFLLLRFPPPTAGGHRFSLRESVKVAAYPGVLVLSLLLLFQTANEQSVVTFTSHWLRGAGASEALATLALAAYQAGMLTGRIVAGRMLTRVSKYKVVIVAASFGVAATVFMWMAQTPQLRFVAAALIGLSFAPLYPTVLAIAGDRYQRLAGSVFGVLFAFGMLGGMIAPKVIGAVSTANVSNGVLVAVAGSVAVVLLAVVAMRGAPASSEER